jgi:hypothetical protein
MNVYYVQQLATLRDKHTFKSAGGTILLDTALWTLVTTGCTVHVILYTATATLVQ